MENFVNWINGYKVGDKGSILDPSGRRLRCRPWKTGRRYANIKQPDGKYKKYIIARLVFKCHGGEIPPGFQINHKNGNKGDDRIINLEAVSPRANILHAYKTGLYGRGKKYPRGVTKTPGGVYFCSFYRDKKRYSLGPYETAEEAASAYRAAVIAAEGEGIKRYL
jgi:hypothetical protein